MDSLLSPTLKLAYLGPKGSHSHEAALSLLASNITHEALKPYVLVPYPSLSRLIEAIHSEAVAFGLLPVENALEGSVIESINALGSPHPYPCALKIVLEFSHPVVHCLIQKGTEPRDITSVLSHPQALGQCQEQLKKAYGDSLNQEAAASTSDAVRRLESLDPSWAALGTESAAKTYNMTVLRKDISDSPDNVTRFMLISSAKNTLELPLKKASSLKTKTFLCMGLKDGPGVLVDMLLVLKAYGVNMTRIESRPNRQEVGSYRFFIDVENDLEQPEYERVKMYLEADTTYLKLIGPYKALGKL